MQCVTSCRRSIVQCEHSSDWMLPQIVVQCENNNDPMILIIMQCELINSLLYFRIFQVQMKIRLLTSCCPSTHTRSTSLLLAITPWKIYHVPHFTHQIYKERLCHVTHITSWSGLERLTWTSAGKWAEEWYKVLNSQKPVAVSCSVLVWLPSAK